MVPSQKNSRERTLETWLAASVPPKRRREIVVDASLEKLEERTVLRAIKRAGKGGVVDLGPGEFSGFAIDRQVELVSREGGLTSVAGTVRVTGGPSILRGVTLRASGDAPALVVSAEFLLEDCDVYGAIEVGRGGALYLQNCRVVANAVAVTLRAGSKIEASACRFSGIPAGLLVEAGAECALYGCRVEGCTNGAAESGEMGAGIYSGGRLYLEGCEIFRNDMGVFLEAAEEFRVHACHFLDNHHTALYVESSGAGGCLITASVLQGPALTERELVHFAGGTATFRDCRLFSESTPPLSANQTTLHIENCVVESRDAPCLEIEGGQLAMRGSRCVTSRAPALKTRHTPGTIGGGTIEGLPPVEQSEAGRLRMEGTVLQTAGSGTSAPPVPAPGGIESYMSRLDEIVGQEPAKKEMRRLLRLAYAARERRSKGLNPGEERFSGIFSGPPGCGKLSAAAVFASILHEMGELRSPDVSEMSLSEAVVADPRALTCGLLFVRTAAGEGLTLKSPGIAEALLRLVRSLDGAAHVVLDGERDLLLGFVRSRPELSREFPVELPFSAYGPPELAELFARHCRSEKIQLSPAAAHKLTVVLHSLHDRLQRRYTDLEGIAGLFAEARRNYLERCAREGRFDLPMEPSDITAPLDRATAAALERFAEIVAVCPDCGAENPWLAGLGGARRCIACGQPFHAPWGFVRNSTFYRRRKIGAEALRSGAVARRRKSASNLSS